MTELPSARVAALFREALDQPDAERAAWLVRACAGDAPLHATIERLVAFDRQTDLAIDRPLDLLIAATLPCVDDARPGERVGPYRVVRKLGEGGMGSVWLADRVDGGFNQQVALKLMRLGHDSDAILVEVHRERNLLAQLHHPDIARLLDGGFDARGRPWFAMEHVEGVELREWIEQTQTDARTRLALFLRLCRAVAYAHERLIVHRDLKPSNVLVRANGAPCLLDFGIARLVDANAAAEASGEHSFLTRAYAAPEQIVGGPLTTATDVFALGAILFELLTGLRYSTLRKEDGSVTRPSAAVQAVGAGPRRVTAAHLRGDLDAIVLRALAADPQRRYAGAQALADDVERYMASRPIRARPGGTFNRVAKFVRRNRFATAAMVAATLAMVVGTAVSLWQTQRAERMADRAERSKGFLIGLLEDANPFDDRPGRKAPPDKLLDNALARIDRDFADAPLVQVEIRTLIQQTLLRTGEPRKARALAQQNVDALRVLEPESPALGIALTTLGVAQEQISEAEASTTALLEADRLLRDAGPAYGRDRIAVMSGLAKLANAAGDHARARQLHETMLGERRRLDGNESPDVAMDLMNLAADAFYVEQYADAEATALQAHAMVVRLLGPDHARLIYVDNVLGLAQASAGHVADALATLTAIERQARATLKPDAPMLATVLGALGYARTLQHDTEGALVALTESHRIAEGTRQPLRGRVTSRLGILLLTLGRADALAMLDLARTELAESGGNGGFLECAQAAYGAALDHVGDGTGEAIVRQALATLRAGKDAGSSRVGEIDLLLAQLLTRPDEADEALHLRRDAFDVFRRVLGPMHPRTLEVGKMLTAAHPA